MRLTLSLIENIYRKIKQNSQISDSSYYLISNQRQHFDKKKTLNLLAAKLLTADDFPEKNFPRTHALMGNGGKTGTSGGGWKYIRKEIIRRETLPC